MESAKKSEVNSDAITESISRWDSESDPCNPRNWPLPKKLTSAAIVSLLTFVNPLSSSMIAPALDDISRDFGIDSHVKTEMMLSMFVLGYLVGPLVWAPLSEMYGRVMILNIGNLVFLAFNLGCGFARTFPQMIVLRFFAGLGGIASLSSGSGLLSDCFTDKQRARVWAFFILMPMIGPSVGPVIGAAIAERTSWRWMFWSTTMFDGLIQMACLIFLRETYAPVILERRTARRGRLADVKETDTTTGIDRRDSLIRQLSNAFKRPVRMLFTQPVLQAMTLYSAFLYGLMYLILATFANVWTSVYDEKTSIAGFNYFSLTIGFAIGELGTAAVQDVYYRSRVKKTADQRGRPEFRLPILIPEALLLPVGLFWYGWSIQSQLHWVMPNIGVAIVAASIMGSSQLVMLYVIDSFPTYTASALSGLLMLRFIAGFAFPLFAPDMYAVLGWGWGNSLLAFISIGIGLPGAIFLLLFSKKLRTQDDCSDDSPVPLNPPEGKRQSK